jgi:hypothetical protein
VIKASKHSASERPARRISTLIAIQRRRLQRCSSPSSVRPWVPKYRLLTTKRDYTVSLSLSSTPSHSPVQIQTQRGPFPGRKTILALLASFQFCHHRSATLRKLIPPLFVTHDQCLHPRAGSIRRPRCCLETKTAHNVFLRCSSPRAPIKLELIQMGSYQGKDTRRAGSDTESTRRAGQMNP